MLKKAAVFVIVLALLLLPVLLVWLLATPPLDRTQAEATPTPTATATPALPGPGQAFRAATGTAEAVATPTPALATVATWALTVRACAGVSCQALGWLHRGEVVVLDGPPASAEDGGTWVPVRTPAGLSGWVNLRFLNLSGGQR